MKQLKTFVFVLALLVSASSVSYAATQSFSDVPKDHFAYPAVMKCIEMGVMTGFDDGTFKGDNKVTRYDLAFMLGRIAETGGAKVSPNFTPFTDVPKNNWCYNYVALATSANLMSGYPDKTFRGNKYITRFELALALAPFFDSSPSGKNSFSDVPKDHWAYDAVSVLADKNVLSGYANGTFRGDNNLSRYEFALIILAFLSAS